MNETLQTNNITIKDRLLIGLDFMINKLDATHKLKP